MNYFKTGVLMAGMTALFLAIGFLMGGQTGMTMALLFAVATNFYAYWNADRMVLRMAGARPIGEDDAPEFRKMVERLAHAAALPVPKIYIIDSPQPNAFATGRNPENAAVAATTGLLRSLTASEIEGVMAHELAHVKNRDTLVMAFTATISGAIAMLANFGFLFGGRDRNAPGGMIGQLLLIFVAPLAAMIVQMAISRTREYAADRRGAEISGKPLALASALQRISATAQRHQNHAADANPAIAHLFIINPLSGLGVGSLFSTHPPTERRVAALQALAAGMGHTPDGAEESRFPGPWNEPPGSPGPWG